MIRNNDNGNTGLHQTSLTTVIKQTPTEHITAKKKYLISVITDNVDWLNHMQIH